ncbi:MAG: ABC transporter substrate-binding protein, partial [Candidatus Odinarchaeota archaeon]
MNLREEHKNILIVVLMGLILVSGIGNIILSMITCGIENLYPHDYLKVARTSNPFTMDPCNCWDSASKDMLDQVVEPLIGYDLNDPELPLIGRLAEWWNWKDNTTITFKLRENVFFHDGSRFTADCVLHTFSRINYFGNWSGSLPRTKPMAVPQSLYKFSDGTPIFNDTISFKTDDYNVTLILNRPYGPVDGLLAYTASSIVHPDSTPLDEMLDISDDLVIGTGPFKMISYIPNSEIGFERWERYWSTGA